MSRQRQRMVGGTILYVALGLLCLLGPPPALAKALLTLEIASVDWRGRDGSGYDPFDPVPYSQTVNFSVIHRGSACSYFVTFSKNTPGNNPRQLRSGGDSLDYQIYDTPSFGNVLKDLPSASPSEVISGSFGPGHEVNATHFVLALPAQQMKPFGTYSDTLQVSVYEGTPGDYSLAQSVTVLITARLAQLASLAVVATGGSFDPQATARSLDFGELTEGKALGCDLRVRSNATYSVSLESLNGGVLKCLEPGSQDTVPYRLEVDGVPTPVSRQPAIFLSGRLATTQPNGDGYALRVVIGNLGDASAGRYRDVITLTVQIDN